MTPPAFTGGVVREHADASLATQREGSVTMIETNWIGVAMCQAVTARYDRLRDPMMPFSI
ncbi:hypothetical protein ACWGNZ_07900 [Sphingomonas zeae]|jgi:hypothetical protein